MLVIQPLVFHKEGFQVPEPSHCQEMIENTNMFS